MEILSETGKCDLCSRTESCFLFFKSKIYTMKVCESCAVSAIETYRIMFASYLSDLKR